MQTETVTLTKTVIDKLFDYYVDIYPENGYILDVLELADDNGYVSERVANKLFKDHGSSMSEYIDAGNPANNALTMLEWLGY